MFWQHFVNKPHWIDKKRQRKVSGKLVILATDGCRKIKMLNHL